MCYTMAAERQIATHSHVRQCVENGNPEVIAYLSEVFGEHKLYYCRPGNECLFVCPRINIPFEVIEPLECFFDQNGSKKGMINPGIYRIVSHATRQKDHLLLIKSEDGKTISCQAGSLMIDWRGIRPVKGADIQNDARGER